MKVTKWLCEATLASSLAFSIGFVSCSPDVETKEVIKTEIVEVEVEKEKESIVEIDKKYAASVTFSSTVNDDNSISVKLSTKTSGAKIYYTTDDKEPTTKSKEYTSELTFTADTTIAAIAVKTGFENSPVSYAKISISEKRVDVKADEIPPADVTNLAATNKDSTILLTWTDNTTDSDIFGYEVTYKANTSSRVVFTPVSTNSIIAAQGSGGCYVYNLINDSEYTFTVKSVDTSGNKSEGVTINATPFALDTSETMKIELSSPEELSNTTITVTAKITSASKIKRVVYKKNGSINAAALLADSEAQDAAQSNSNDDTIWTFDADKKDTWTVAAIDEAGREETAQIYTRTIDKTPPTEVSNVNSQYSKVRKSIEITWNDPVETADQYDSPFDHVIVTYTVDDGTEVTTVDQSVPKGTEAIEITGINLNAECYNLLVHSVDKLGNTSEGKLTRCYTGNAIIATADNVVEKIANMTQSGTVKVTGALTSFNDIRSAVKELSSDIRIKLDFSETEASQLDPYFKDCKNLDSIILPNGITTINCSAFSNCTSLSSVTIPNSVTYIDSYAFLGCSSLTTVAIPESVTYIGHRVFEKCVSLTSINIPDSVTYIGESAFYNCSSLDTLTIGNGVTSIGNSTFYGCESLTSVTIPDSVTSIGESAFYNCSSLDTLTIGNGVTSIGNSAFNGCKSLTSVTIPDSVTSIGNSAFFDCSSLDTLTIGNGVTSIEYGAFCNCSSLGTLTIGNGVTSIGDNAFYGCKSLTSVTIPDSVTSIGEFAFYNCSSLGTLTIGNGVTSIENSAFSGCQSLTSVTIPNSVATIGYGAFTNCGHLNTINYRGTKEQWEAINIASQNANLTSATINYNYMGD